MEPNFQQLLNQFNGEIIFKEMLEKLAISPDEFLYMIETDQGIYYIFETDCIFNFDDVIQPVKSRTESFSCFVEAKLPPERFEDIPSARYYASPKYYPPDFEEFKKYVSFGQGSFADYFTFLIKK